MDDKNEVVLAALQAVIITMQCACMAWVQMGKVCIYQRICVATMNALPHN